MRSLMLAGLTAVSGLAMAAGGPPVPCAAPRLVAENAIAVQAARAPGMQVRSLGRQGAHEVYFLTFKSGDDLLSGLAEFARLHGVKSGSVSAAVGALACTVTGWYDTGVSRLHTRALPGNREVTSLGGNLSMLGDQPLAHLHVAVADRSGRVLGGHLVRAVVGPGLEMTVTATPEPLQRIEDRAAAAFVPVMP